MDFIPAEKDMSNPGYVSNFYPLDIADLGVFTNITPIMTVLQKSSLIAASLVSPTTQWRMVFLTSAGPSMLIKRGGGAKHQ